MNSVLAYCAMAMWGETEMDRLRDLSAEIDHLRRESRQNFGLDHLTGLLNQAALARRVEEPSPFEGVVAVCDMDNFKDINDRYGHLTGDEILRNIGHLLQASIRLEDEAFRWGGDEFVLLFHDQRLAVADKRMTSRPACAIFACAGSACCPSPSVGARPTGTAARCATRWMRPTTACTR